MAWQLSIHIPLEKKEMRRERGKEGEARKREEERMMTHTHKEKDSKWRRKCSSRKTGKFLTLWHLDGF